MFAFRQKNEPAVEEMLYGRKRVRRCRLAVLVAQFDSGEQAYAADTYVQS